MNGVELGRRWLEVPILQGGMGIGVSLGRLAGAVAACGGMGTVSTAVPGFDEPDFARDPQGANLRALRREVRRAREIAGKSGLVAVNAMVATTQYADSVRAAIEAGVDAIVSGAGLPLELPAIAEGADVLLAPVVSGPRAAGLIARAWQKRGRLPDFVLVEGSEAGGHLGFDRQTLRTGTAPTLAELVARTVEALAPFGRQRGRAIPVFAAGGLWTGADAARMEAAGAAGVQFATRFIATPECDASQAYKDVMLAARPQDVALVDSPVGMPGRALRTPLVRRLEEGLRLAPSRCVDCLRPCGRSTATYCIARALIRAVRGDYENGLFFCGAGVHRLEGMHSVAWLMKHWKTEWRAFA